MLEMTVGHRQTQGDQQDGSKNWVVFLPTIRKQQVRISGAKN